MNDPWKHRVLGLRCQTCMWFVEKKQYVSANPVPESLQQVNDERGNLGLCRRHAPSMIGYPPVFSMDWCGDHRLDENKL